jgi:type IV secretory pathway VirB2 component (pilin)
VAPSSGTKDGLGDDLRNQLQPLLPSVNITFVIIAIIVAGVALYLGRKWVARKVLS